MGTPPSILEIEMSIRNESDFHEYVNRILNALRLYKLGSVYPIESISTKKTALWPGASARSWGHENYVPAKLYTVKSPERDGFADFVDIIERKLRINKEEKEGRSLLISNERYVSALLEAIDIDRKLMTAVMGLESLFTLEKDKGENAFKLGIRVAKLLGNLNFGAERVRALIEEAYGFRNMVVHGSYIPQVKREKMNEIFPEILNYLRVSLIVFLLTRETGKTKMVEMIDESTINDIKNESMKKTLEKNTRSLKNYSFSDTIFKFQNG